MEWIASTLHSTSEQGVSSIILRLKCDGTRAETRFLLSAKRSSPFKLVGGSFQSTTGRRAVHISLQGWYYWQASCTHQPAGLVLLVEACVLQSRDAYLLPTPFSCFSLHFSFRASPCAIKFQTQFTTAFAHTSAASSRMN
jgi:hypothetical protein